MLRDNLVGLIEPMLSSAGAYTLALGTARKQSSDDRPPCLENPRPEGAESTLTENAASPFHAEPKQVQQLTQEIRTASYLLHPPLLDEAGLSAALKMYVEGVSERGGLSVTLTLPKALERFSRDAELAIFRVVQECLTNVHRHSGSKSAAIHLNVSEGNILVEVRDRGRGMSVEKLSGIQSNGTGVGIRGMSERVRQLGGKISIQSDGSGTTVSVSLPAPLVPKCADNVACAESVYSRVLTSSDPIEP